ncbi:helix-turn-helix transcriptional regulator [Bacillus sp. V3B]|uniref:helix-turn-helix domain-containing protein n=1 Tax=Bacillus sp. V3B TaxID=2804915 RepID=UPI00210C7C24|nr:helix-turn-helix transcriptional regulator [Bacillus sp. V3B]MCQ6275790.1 helix-turn-helix transcriptional regulator [Bacillus sp. V3B]
MLGERIANLRKKRNLSQYDLAERLGFSRGKLANYEQGSRQPDYDTLKKIADFFDESVEYLLYGEKKQENAHNLTDKDEKDIAKRMEEIRNDLSSEDGLMFSGEPMSEEAIESLLEAMEYAVRQTQRINKKYIPKKHRKDEDHQ